MASVLIRETERAAIITLRANAPMLAILPKTSIDPQPGTAGVDADGAPKWPFIRLDASQAIPRGRGCTARSEVRFRLHSFAKPRYDPSGKIIETAKDYAGRLNDAVIEAIHGHAYVVAGRRYRFIVSSANLMQDGAEADAYHGIAAIVARAHQG